MEKELLLEEKNFLAGFVKSMVIFVVAIKKNFVHEEKLEFL